jgi:TRAP-type C4-dicarboxylate transport system substrate-binding protein
VNAQGQGALTVDVRDDPSIANVINMYSRVMNDVVQIGWSCQAFVAGHFPRSDILSLPFLFSSSEIASAAFYRLYKTGALDAEFDEARPIMLTATPQANLHTAKALRAPDALAGLKLAAQARYVNQVIVLLSAAPVSMPVTDMYQALQRGTIDGVVTGWSAFPPYKPQEVTTYHVDTTLGATPCMFFMAKKKYAALATQARDVLDKNSTEADSRAFGAFWDRIQAESREMVKVSGKRTVVELTPDETAKWRNRVLPVHADWIKSTPNGDKLLAQFNELLAEVRAGR